MSCLQSRVLIVLFRKHSVKLVIKIWIECLLLCWKLLHGNFSNTPNEKSSVVLKTLKPFGFNVSKWLSLRYQVLQHIQPPLDTVLQPLQFISQMTSSSIFFPTTDLKTFTHRGFAYYQRLLFPQPERFRRNRWTVWTKKFPHCGVTTFFPLFLVHS